MEILTIVLRVAAVLVFAAAMIWALVSDLRTFEVPNQVPAAIVLAFPLFALGNGAGWDMVLNHVATGAGVLVVCFTLFLVRVMGAGDAKLLAAGSLWMGWPLLVSYLFSIAIAGGIFAVVLLLFRRWTLPVGLGSIDWVRRLHDRKKDIPYAVAIALPAVFLVTGMSLPAGVTPG